MRLCWKVPPATNRNVDSEASADLDTFWTRLTSAQLSTACRISYNLPNPSVGISPLTGFVPISVMHNNFIPRVGELSLTKATILGPQLELRGEVREELISQVDQVSLSSPFTSGVLGSIPVWCTKWIGFSVPATWMPVFFIRIISLGLFS